MNSEKTTPAPGGVASPRPTRPFSSQGVAWAVLIIALLATGGGWFISRMHADLTARKQFDDETSRVRAALSERMEVYRGVLYGAVGLYAASYSVERAEWHAYMQSMSVEKRFPGVDGLGFVASVPRDKVDEFLKITREDGAPDFQLQNPGDSNELYIIKYVEPEERHRTSLGHDLGREPERRAVAEKARDSGGAAISAKLMVSTAGQRPQPGFLMMVPVYRRGTSIVTVDERRANILGWVYARFVAEQLMRETLEEKSTLMRFEVFDGATADPKRLIFDSDPGQNTDSAASEPRFIEQTPIAPVGHVWTLRFSSKPAFEANVPRLFSVLVGVGGGLISLLLFGIAWSLSRTRERAVVMATDMTAELLETNVRLQQEIAERQRAEQLTKDSEALYHSLVETLPLNILQKDLQGRVTFANQRFCDQVGRPREEITGKSESDLFPPGLAKKHQSEDQWVIQSGNALETVEEVRDADGATRFLQLIKTPVRGGTGMVVGVLGIFWDITDKRQAEEELKHERHLLRTLMDNLPDRIYFKDAQSRFMRVNKAMFSRRGLSDLTKIIGRTDFDFFTEEHARQAYKDEQQVIETGRPINKEERETWPDGSVTWALSTKMPLRNEQGGTVGTFGISRDITDRKRAEEALRQAKDVAEEASRTKSQFLANMSHELRTPLNSVIGFANILLKNKARNLRDDDLTFLERIVANGKHLLGLINEILDLSKIEARKIELELTSVSLAALVQEIVDQFEGQLRGRGVKLIADLPPMMVTIETDAVKLKQVIFNLIGNALKFTERGNVTVRVAVDPQTRQPIRIDVIDTGIGIAADRLTAVFEAFQQADSSTARKYGGTGLGLTISKALCELMGYRIKVSSQVGTGTTFSVIIPLADRPAPAAAPSAAEPVNSMATDSSPGNKLVLVVDDEADSRILLTNLIEECGCRVITVDSGEQALRRAAETRPDLILLDLMMPQMDGWQVMNAVKSDPQLRDIPVVVTSIVAKDNRGTLLGALDILQKPVTREDLLRVLKACPRPKVLIIEDSDLDRRLMVESLQAEAGELRTTSNGREGLQLLETFSPDVIVLDLLMPEMDGMTFLSQLRKDPRHEQLPVFVVTSKKLTPDEKQHLTSRAQGVFTKVEDWAADLQRMLHGLLNRNSDSPMAPRADPPSGIGQRKDNIMNEPDVLDDEALVRLRRLGKSGKFVCDMIDLFLGYAPAKVAAARTALQSGDLRGVAMAVHPLKSGAGNMGARVVQQLATGIEGLANDGQSAALPTLLQDLETAVTVAKSRLEAAKLTIEP